MEDVLYEAHPRMFRNKPVSFIISVILCFVGIGLIILLAWWLTCRNQKLIVTREKVIKREGISSKNTNEVYISDIRAIQTTQTLQQRIFKAGALSIATSGTGGVEISISGIPNPEKVKAIIEEQRRAVA